MHRPQFVNSAEKCLLTGGSKTMSKKRNWFLELSVVYWNSLQCASWSKTWSPGLFHEVTLAQGSEGTITVEKMIRKRMPQAHTHAHTLGIHVNSRHRTRGEWCNKSLVCRMLTMLANDWASVIVECPDSISHIHDHPINISIFWGEVNPL